MQDLANSRLNDPESEPEDMLHLVSALEERMNAMDDAARRWGWVELMEETKSSFTTDPLSYICECPLLLLCQVPFLPEAAQ